MPSLPPKPVGVDGVQLVPPLYKFILDEPLLPSERKQLAAHVSATEIELPGKLVLNLL
jgi:hypothetical protein